MKVYFVGAGPGDPELITVKGRRLVREADIVIYAGSLVNPELLDLVKEGADVHDSAGMNLDEVTAIYRNVKNNEGVLVRLHTGDPSMYGAIQEQIDFLRQENIPFEVVPGVSSVFAAAASLAQEFTLPGISQSLILSRMEGRTPVPERERIEKLAQHRTSMVLFLSVKSIGKVVEELLQGYPAETPVAVVYRASWPDEKKVTGTLSDIAGKVESAQIDRQALILVGDVLRSVNETGFYDKSKLYDSSFTHGYRKGSS